MKRYIKSSYPDFSSLTDARKFLDEQDYGRIKLVAECRERILSEYIDTNYAKAQHKEKEIIRDYQEIAAEEWKDLSVEEAIKLFDDIMKAIETLNFDETADWL